MFSVLCVPILLPAPGKYWYTQPAAIMRAPIMLPSTGKYLYWCAKAAATESKQKLYAAAFSFLLDENE